MTFPIARLRVGLQKTPLGPAALGMSFADPPLPGGGECTRGIMGDMFAIGIKAEELHKSLAIVESLKQELQDLLDA